MELVERLNVFQTVLGADEVLPVFQVADAGVGALTVFLEDESVTAEIVGVDVDTFQLCEHLLFGHARVFCGDVLGKTCAVEQVADCYGVTGESQRRYITTLTGGCRRWFRGAYC